MNAAALTALHLALHRQTEPRTVLRHLIDGLHGAYGRAVAAVYLLSPATGEYRLHALEDAASRVTPAVWRSQLQAPLALQREATPALLARLAEAGAGARLTDHLDDALGAMWPDGVAVEVQRALGARHVALAPVVDSDGLAGLLLLFLIGPWPFEVATQSAAHAAVAIANQLDRQHGARAATDLFMRSVIEQVAEREIARATRYGRGLSVAIVGLEEDAAAESRLLAMTALVARVMRLPDTAGRLDRQRLVVLLPETSPAGAGGFVRRLRAAAGDDLATLRCATASYPGDGSAWQELVETALGRFQRVDAASGGVPAEVAPAQRSLARLRVRVAPISEEEAGAWRGLLARQAAVTSVELETADGLMATYAVTAPSVARLLAQLGQLAGKVGASITPTLNGDIGINLVTNDGGRVRLRQPVAASGR